MQADRIEKAVFDNFIKKLLIIWQWLVSINVWVTEFNQHGTDILMFQFDCCFCSVIEKFLKVAVMFSLIIWFATKFHRKHLEIIRDRSFDFFA